MNAIFDRRANVPTVAVIRCWADSEQGKERRASGKETSPGIHIQTRQLREVPRAPTESERALATQSLSLCGMERGFARGASSPLYQQESGSNGEAQRMLPPWLGHEGEGAKWSSSNS